MVPGCSGEKTKKTFLRKNKVRRGKCESESECECEWSQGDHKHKEKRRMLVGVWTRKGR